MTVALLAWFLSSPLAALVIGASIRFANDGTPSQEVAVAADDADCPVAEEIAAA